MPPDFTLDPSTLRFPDSLRVAADKLGTTASTLHRWEKGHSPPAEKIAAYANVYELDAVGVAALVSWFAANNPVQQ